MIEWQRIRDIYSEFKKLWPHAFNLGPDPHNAHPRVRKNWDDALEGFANFVRSHKFNR